MFFSFFSSILKERAYRKHIAARYQCLMNISRLGFQKHTWRDPWMWDLPSLKDFMARVANSKEINILTGVSGSGKSAHAQSIADELYERGDVSGVFITIPNVNEHSLSMLDEFRASLGLESTGKTRDDEEYIPIADLLHKTNREKKPLLIIIDEFDILSWRGDMRGNKNKFKTQLREFLAELEEAIMFCDISVLIITYNNAVADVLDEEVLHSMGERYEMRLERNEIEVFINMFPACDDLKVDERNRLVDITEKGGALSLVSDFFKTHSFGVETVEDNFRRIDSMLQTRLAAAARAL